MITSFRIQVKIFGTPYPHTAPQINPEETQITPENDFFLHSQSRDSFISGGEAVLGDLNHRVEWLMALVRSLGKYRY
jgi:hypothetical protein